MATSVEPASSSLFNNQVLSDITIRQTYNGESKEFYAHKAVLCAHSQWFMKAFTGSFKEASESVIEMHDDEPIPFEFMLRFFYNDHEDLTSCDFYYIKSEENLQKHLFMPIQLHGIGDKYDAMPLQDWAAGVLKTNLSRPDQSLNLKDEVCCRLVREYYSQCQKPGTTIGTILAEYLTWKKGGFICDSLCDELIRQLPIFGSDVLLALKPKFWKLLRD